jgi:hypothetical protein
MRTLRSAAKYAQCDTRIANATLRKLRYFADQQVFTGACFWYCLSVPTKPFQLRPQIRRDYPLNLSI